MKQVIINYENGLPVGVIEIKSLEVSKLNELKAECEKNYQKLQDKKALDKQLLNSRLEMLDHQVALLSNCIADLVKQIKEIKGEDEDESK